MRFSLGLSFLATATLALASNVLELTPDNWDEHVGQGKPALVELCVFDSHVVICSAEGRLCD